MEQKITSRESVPKKTLEEIEKDFEDEAMQAIENGELTQKKFIDSFRKDKEEIMGRIAVKVEKKEFEKERNLQQKNK